MKTLEFGRNVSIGNGELVVIASIYAVKSCESLSKTANKYIDAGADIINIYPEKSNGSKELEKEDYEIILEMKEKLRFPIIAEVTNVEDYGDLIKQSLDGCITNQQETSLMEKVAELQLPTLINGFSSNKIKDWIYVSNYFQNKNENIGFIGNNNNICIDIVASIRDFIKSVKEETSLPFAFNPSYDGISEEMIEENASSGIIAGVDALIIPPVKFNTLESIATSSKMLYEEMHEHY